MKFVIDTERKVITLEESANLAKFVEVIEKMLGKSWKDYTLEKTITFNWRWDHIYIRPYVYPTFPTFYTSSGNAIGTDKLPPIITYSSSGEDAVNGTVTGFNIQ